MMFPELSRREGNAPSTCPGKHVFRLALLRSVIHEFLVVHAMYVTTEWERGSRRHPHEGVTDIKNVLKRPLDVENGVTTRSKVQRVYAGVCATVCQGTCGHLPRENLQAAFSPFCCHKSAQLLVRCHNHGSRCPFISVQDFETVVFTRWRIRENNFYEKKCELIIWLVIL